MGGRHVAWVIALSTFAAPACATRPTIVRVALDQAADSTPPSAVPHVEGLRLYVEPVLDERPDKSKIGSNREESTEVPVVADGTAPPDFVGRLLATELSHSAVTIAPDTGSANRLLRVRLIHFFAEEGGLYRANVGAILEVRDPGGKLLYSSSLTGQAKQWGSSLSPENYNEVFSRAVFDLGKNALEQAAFQKALAVEGGSAAPAPPAAAAKP